MCIQEFGFLDPRIKKHPSYPKVKAAHQAKEAHDLMLYVVRASCNPVGCTISTCKHEIHI